MSQVTQVIRQAILREASDLVEAAAKRIVNGACRQNMTLNSQEQAHIREILLTAKAIRELQ